MNPGAEASHLRSKCVLEVRRRDVFCHLLAGADGWGHPFDRVLHDVLLGEKLTAEYARREYGVAIDSEAGKVLYGETARLRAERRAG